MNTQDNFDGFLKEQFEALTILYNHHLLMPFLAVLYSTIEILGHVTALTFDGFVKKYMRNSLPNSVSSADLWGGRCSILHSNSPESDHSRKKKAKEILYAWGKADINLAKEIIKKSGKHDQYTYIRVEDLFLSLKNGAMELRNDLNQNPEFFNACSKKIDKFYSRINVKNTNWVTP